MRLSIAGTGSASQDQVEIITSVDRGLRRSSFLFGLSAILVEIITSVDRGLRLRLYCLLAFIS
ncbi:hypothetical protein, partial [Candidatus Aquicultor secundus]|uniref:hypothetical protein n=1 Tax=Candidatus Aquicultor secundus TaxID=1973895 RepID=UPI00257E9691